MSAAEIEVDYHGEIGPVARLTRDLRKASQTLTEDEARYLVDLYYATQENRIRAAGQIRASIDAHEPNGLLQWAFSNFHMTEQGCKSALHGYVQSKRVGRWLLSIHGIGPVIAAGLIAHIDITRAPTVGHIWRFAGLDPTVKWERKTKRPWNAALKVLCWKAGQSFMKLRAGSGDIYGKVYEERKAFEIARNERGENAEAARLKLETQRFGQNITREHLEAGRLAPGQIDARARRYAVKLFLSHLHHVMHEDHFGKPPPRPYVIEHGGHAHFLAPPHWPID